jgi:hypothetical protein
LLKKGKTKKQKKWHSALFFAANLTTSHRVTNGVHGIIEKKRKKKKERKLGHYI